MLNYSVSKTGNCYGVFCATSRAYVLFGKKKEMENRAKELNVPRVIDPSQITRLTWQGITQPNYGGNTFKSRVLVTAQHIGSGCAKLTDYQCYTFNGGENISEQFYQAVNAALKA